MALSSEQQAQLDAAIEELNNLTQRCNAWQTRRLEAGKHLESCNTNGCPSDVKQRWKDIYKEAAPKADTICQQKRDAEKALNDLQAHIEQQVQTAIEAVESDPDVVKERIRAEIEDRKTQRQTEVELKKQDDADKRKKLIIIFAGIAALLGTGYFIYKKAKKK